MQFVFPDHAYILCYVHMGFHDEDKVNNMYRMILGSLGATALLRQGAQEETKIFSSEDLDTPRKCGATTTTTLQTPEISDSNSVLALGRLEIAALVILNLTIIPFIALSRSQSRSATYFVGSW